MSTKRYIIKCDECKQAIGETDSLQESAAGGRCAVCTPLRKEKFQRGDKVECNGNREARVLDYYSKGMVEVRLFSGLRHVGDVCVDESELKPIA